MMAATVVFRGVTHIAATKRELVAIWLTGQRETRPGVVRVSAACKSGGARTCGTSSHNPRTVSGAVVLRRSPSPLLGPFQRCDL